MSTARDYEIGMEGILGLLNRLPEEDRVVGHDIWRRGGAEALCIFAEVLHEISTINKDVAVAELSSMLYDACLRFLKLMQDDGVMGGAA